MKAKVAECLKVLNVEPLLKIGSVKTDVNVLNEAQSRAHLPLDGVCLGLS